MQANLDRPAARHWADVLAIVTAVILIGIAVWPGQPSATADADRETTTTPALWLAHAAAGSLTLLAVGLAQRWRNRAVARIVLVGAAVVLLAALFVFRDFTVRAMFTTVVPAVALLISAAAIGPMPRELNA